MFSTAISLVRQNAVLCGNGLKVIQMTKFVPDKIETLWEKEEMLITRICSCSRNDFKRLLSEGR